MSDTINDMPTMIDQQQLAQELDELSAAGVPAGRGPASTGCRCAPKGG